MKIFWKQLGRLVNLKQVDLKETAVKLTLAGLEVDSIKYIEEIQDTLLEISITANRQDVVGWIQIAVEIAAIIKQPLRLNQRLNNIQQVDAGHLSGLNPLYEVYACQIQPTSMLNQDAYATKYIQALDLNATKSIIDIAQFINLKWGQDIKVYKVEQGQYQIKNLIISHNKEKNSKKDNFSVHIDSKKLVEINTSNIYNMANNVCVLLLNCRQKKQMDNRHCFHAYSEMLNSIKVSVGTTDKVLVYRYSHQEISMNKITVTPDQINRVLGPIGHKNTQEELDLCTIADITSSLNMTTKIIKKHAVIIIPRNREDDIKSNTDIAEEVGRIYGFDKFYGRLPRFRDKSQKLRKYTPKQKIRRILRSMGLHEIINQAFEANKTEERNAQIINPISQEQINLRANLISGIINTKRHNINQGNYNFEAFEIGKVFAANKCQHIYEESSRLSFMLGNNKFNQSTWQTDATSLSWLQAKGQTEEIFERINANVSWSTKSSSNQLIESLKHHIHQQNSLYIMYEDKTIGLMSQTQNFGNSIKAKSYFVEISLDDLITAIKPKNHLRYTYKQYSAYPKISRDFSVTVSSTISMQEISESIKSLQNQEGKIIESIDAISEYYHSKNKKTICFRIIYGSKDKTLTSQEVKILDNILKSELSIFQSKT